MMRTLLHRLLRRLGAHDGVAMPVVMSTLTLVSGLAVTTYAVSLEGNQASARDRDSKQALAAAEAGLQMAALKVSEVRPDPPYCVTNAAVLPGTGNAPSPTECPSLTKDIGNGATYTYTVATPGSPGETCPTVPGFTANNAKDRCITSIGEVNGVRRRLQMRFAYEPPFIPWGNAGLVGKDRVEIDNNKIINSTVGTNGHVEVGNNTDIIGSLMLPDGTNSDGTGDPTATSSFGNNSGATGGVVDHDEWTFPALDWSVLPRQDNDNALLAGIPGWDPTTKILTLAHDQTITLPSDSTGVTDFHLCGINASGSNRFWLNVPNGKVTRLWIDSPRGASSGCEEHSADNPYKTGTFVIKNNGYVNASDDANPAELEVYVYGTASDSTSDPDVDFKNGVAFYGTIWAPDSSIKVFNNQNVAGAFTSKNIDLKNNGGFSYDNRIANKSLPGTASAKNLSWVECRRDPASATDPESGCS
ncbi:MAG TPA: hypothetical protein VHF89_17320 [Solirubrobacteraceae bacterium]|nr:hypothetical protein [Solirubrobacteraceae bacterium]